MGRSAHVADVGQNRGGIERLDCRLVTRNEELQADVHAFRLVEDMVTQAKGHEGRGARNGAVCEPCRLDAIAQASSPLNRSQILFDVFNEGRQGLRLTVLPFGGGAKRRWLHRREQVAMVRVD